MQCHVRRKCENTIRYEEPPELFFSEHQKARFVRCYTFATRFYEAAQTEAKKEAEQRDQELMSGHTHVTALSSPDG